jgi:hypothetical protein
MDCVVVVVDRSLSLSLSYCGGEEGRCGGEESVVMMMCVVVMCG